MTHAPIIVAIDGPAGAGKSSVTKAVATRLDFSLVDTGAIYRCVALAAFERGVSADDDVKLEKLLQNMAITFRMEGGRNRVFIDGKDVSEAIRTPENSLRTSVISARPIVRNGLLGLQRQLAKAAPKGAILEGRDIGTVVFPDADVKLFVTASDEARAKRRFLELKAKDEKITLEQVLADQRARDLADSTRSVAPLKQADDAICLDTTELTLDQVVDRVVEAIERLRPSK